VRARGRRAIVVAGRHEYGLQLDGQLELASLPRTLDPGDADLVVLCGLASQPETERAKSLTPLPVIAFDGVQGSDLGHGRDVSLALPFAPSSDLAVEDLFAGVGKARQAATLALALFNARAHDRHSFLAALRGSGEFDHNGDPKDPPVWLWRAAGDWTLTPESPLGQ